ncbi:ABC transporter permease [Microlunatus ginsengisoli]
MTAVLSEPFSPAASATTRRSRRLPRLGVAGWCAAVFLIAMVVMAVFAPLIAPYDPDAADLLAAYAPPSAEHWLGTDGTGRDIASRLIYGARPSLLGPAAIVVMTVLVGIPLALLAAWRRSGTEFAITRAFDILFAIPGLLLAILAVAMFGPGLGAAAVALAIAYLPYFGRLAHTAAVTERNRPYVTVLQVQGHGPMRINVRHVLRNLSPMLTGQASVTFAYALIDLAALSFLGLGVQAPQADWGVLVSDRDALLRGHPLGVVAAAVAIVLTVMSLFTLGSKLSGEES